MTQEQLEEAIKQRWITGWEALHPPSPDPDFIPYTFADESFDGVEVYAHIAIEPTVRVRTTQSRAFARYEARGIIRVRLFGSINVGGAQLAGLVDEIIGTPDEDGVLDESRIGDLIYREGTHRPGPRDGRWEMRVVVVPYELRT